jgi:hypothetical protein
MSLGSDKDVVYLDLEAWPVVKEESPDDGVARERWRACPFICVPLSVPLL